MSDLLKGLAENSAKFAGGLGSSKIETEHLLFGILCAKGSYAEKVLSGFGISKENYKKVI